MKALSAILLLVFIFVVYLRENKVASHRNSFSYTTHGKYRRTSQKPRTTQSLRPRTTTTTSSTTTTTTTTARPTTRNTAKTPNYSDYFKFTLPQWTTDDGNNYGDVPIFSTPDNRPPLRIKNPKLQYWIAVFLKILNFDCFLEVIRQSRYQSYEFLKSKGSCGLPKRNSEILDSLYQSAYYEYRNTSLFLDNCEDDLGSMSSDHSDHSDHVNCRKNAAVLASVLVREHSSTVTSVAILLANSFVECYEVEVKMYLRHALQSRADLEVCLGSSVLQSLAV